MLDKALFTRIGTGALDLGQLAETILFYGSTHLVLNRGSLGGLAKLLPPDELTAFLGRTEVRLTYLRAGYGVVTTGAFGVSQFIAFEMHGRDAKKKVDFKEEIEEVLTRTLGAGLSSQKIARAIGDRVQLHKFAGVPEGSAVITGLAIKDIQDARFLQDAARTVLAHLIPPAAVPDRFRFGAIDTGKGFLVDTDLDFTKLNEIYHQRVPATHSTITPAYMLSHIIDARSDSYFAAEYLAEIVTTPVHSNLIRLKHYDFIRRREKSTEALELFKEAAIPDMPSVREVLNSGERSAAEFLVLLDKAQKFRGWLADAHPDTNIIAAYIKQATSETWADKLPTKTTRWAIATGLGVAVDAIVPTGLGTLAGVGLGAVDTFALDRMIKGWRPNHFIEGPYKEFVSTTREPDDEEGG